MKFIKNFRGARKGEAFPTDFKAGQDCPPEMLAAARAAGAVAKEPIATPARKKAGRGSTNNVAPQA